MGQCERLGRDGHPMTSEKPSLWRRQQELCSAKMRIDTSCLEIGTIASITQRALQPLTIRLTALRVDSG
jgi:hypothetical protein